MNDEFRAKKEEIIEEIIEDCEELLEDFTANADPDLVERIVALRQTFPDVAIALLIGVSQTEKNWLKG